RRLPGKRHPGTASAGVATRSGPGDPVPGATRFPRAAPDDQSSNNGSMKAIVDTPTDNFTPRTESTQLMSVIVTELTAPVMRARLYQALGVYVRAMDYPRGIEHTRAPMWAEHILREGWRAVAAF